LRRELALVATRTSKRDASRESASGSLERYHEKRDFGATPEPRGGKIPAAKKLRFVIQKHDATRLHYDFRLEYDGVLASWAVPKGPSLDTTERRLAMHVEDHPLDYRDFEGVIPDKQYGAGPVIVWDRGTYGLAEGTDPGTEIAKGKIKFILSGKRMRGEFTLVRIKPKEGEKGDPWLLIKDHDKYVDPAYEVTQDLTSVKSGKTLEQIAADPRSRTWQSVPKKNAAAKSRRVAKIDPLPKIAQPMLATLIDAPFDDPAWLFEIKWDGYRGICTVDEKGKLTLISRNGNNLLQQFPEMAGLADAFSTLPIVVDGEIVALDENERASFGRLQEHQSDPGALNFVAFDLLYADGRDVRQKPLEDRKELLQRVIDDDLVIYSKHVIGEGVALFKQAQQLALEGIIGKRRDSTYQSRRTRDWVKIKAQLEQEFVVGGWTDPRGSRKGFGALLLGVYVGKALRYVGSVGTGFDAKALRETFAILEKTARATSPFDGEVDALGTTHWVTPTLVAQVRFTEWTRDDHLRQPAFLGFRTDKAVSEVVRERPSHIDAARSDVTPVARDAHAGAPAARRANAVNDTIGGRRLAFSNLDKVLWPRDGYTKGDLIAYYQRVANWLIPHLRGRPLTLERYPNGIDAGSFFEKQIPKGTPDWVERVTIPRKESERRDITYTLCNDAATLSYLANLAAMVLHTWISRVGSLDEPDYLFFDLDVGDTCTLATVAKVALASRDLLEEIGLKPLVKTSGATGLHVVVPLAPGYSYATCKALAELAAYRIADALPSKVTLQRTVAKRPQDAVYFDYLQIGRGKTLVPPYVVRPRDGAPVSTPLSWEQVEAYARSRIVEPWKAFAAFTIANVPEMLERDGDAWAGRGWKEAKLEPAIAKARKLWQ
jgi:bifunctional non-homologous end joining protein LigD